MKSRFLLTGAIAALILTTTSCSKSDDGTTVNGVPFPLDVAARYIAYAFSNATCGLNYHMERCAQYSQEGASGIIVDTTMVMKRTDSAAPVKYYYTVTYYGSKIGGSAPKFSFNYTAPGSFSGSSMFSEDQQNCNYSVTGMEPATQYLTMNGNGHDGGNQLSEFYKINFSTGMTFYLHDVEVDKNTTIIKSGTATIHITCTQVGGSGSTYSGTLTFKGNRQASLLLDTLTYGINLSTGAISK